MNDLSQLKPKLLRLRMSGVLDNLELRMSEAGEQRWSYSEFLVTLFQDEIERRENKTLLLRLKRAELDPQKTLVTFDFGFNSRIHGAQIRELATGRFVAEKENVFLLGPSGVGKSHLAMALGHELCRRGTDVFFRRTLAMLKWLQSGRGDGTFERRLRSVAEVPLLILDDFGLNELNIDQQNDLYEVICQRYERCSTIITSNRDFAEWQGIFTNPLLGSAAMDRLVHRAIKIVIEGESYRVSNFRKRNAVQELTSEK